MESVLQGVITKEETGKGGRGHQKQEITDGEKEWSRVSEQREGCSEAIPQVDQECATGSL